MKWLMRVFKSRAFLLVFGFLLALALVLALGEWLEWSWTIRLAGVIVVLLLCIGIMMLSFMRANRSADRIERSIKQQAEQQLLSTRPDKQGEIQELQRQLEQSIERLKQSKLGRGQRGRAALYALPWYMFIGPPGAGKTTAIANSGLNFPLGIDSVRGVGGTRNCDWFFTDQAILLDTAGRYMTEQEDSEEWLAFLETLKEHRSERPVNGVIVGIGIDELVNARVDEIEWHADNIRRRIDELIARLGVQFPVYLVFTKCDLLQGFVEFFGEYSRRDREQIWGCTLDQEQQESAEFRAVFEQEFERLESALINRRTARLSRPMKREERQRVYAFPLQFASVKDNLARFVNRLFQPNPYQESPVFRGFYFTSGTQEGVPLDRVIQTIAQQFDLAPAMGFGEDFASETETKSYFIKDLFTDVVVPDQYMVRRTSKATRQGSVRRWGITAAAAVLLVLFILGASQAVVRSKVSLNNARETATAAGFVRWDDQAAATENLSRMDRLRDEMDRLEHGSLLGLGLTRNSSVYEPTRRLYLDNVRAMIQQYPFRTLQNRLNTAARGLRIDDAERDVLYDQLKAYLLLTSEASRLQDGDEAEGLRTFLARTLTDLTTENLQQQSNLSAIEVRERVTPQVDEFVAALRRDTTLAFTPEPRTITQVRTRITEPPSIRSLYERLRRDGRDLLQPITLSTLIPDRYVGLLQTDDEVSGFFTKNGWETYVSEKIEEVSKDPGRDDWVLGRTQEEVPAAMQNREKVAGELADMYFNDYASAWERFLRSVKVRSFRDVEDAARAMEDLSNSFESPITYLLAQATEQTRFTSELAENVKEQAEEGVGRAVERGIRRVLPGSRAKVPGKNGENELHPVDRRFQGLHSLNATRAQSNEASADLYDAFDGLRNVSSSLDDIGRDEAKAASFASQVLASDGGDLDRQMDDIKRSMRALDQRMMQALFIAPIEQSWAAVMTSAQTYLNERWRDVVYQPFQDAFASDYPFNANSSADAPIGDVAAFFEPGKGPVNTFLNEDLQPFIGRDLDRPKTWEGRGVQLSPAARQAIQRAQAIEDGLFNSGQIAVEFDLQPDQPLQNPASAPDPSVVALRLLGQEITYQMGTPFWTSFRWPGNPGAVLTLSTQQDVLRKTYDGDWALFRLLQAGRVNARSSTQYQVQVPFPDTPYTVLFNLRTKSSSNPFRDPRTFFDFRPPQTLN